MSVEEIKQALTDAISNGVSKQDIKDLEIRFLESLEKRNEDQKDVDSLFSSFQTQMEKKLSEIQQSLPKASNDQGQEKETFGDFLVKVRHNDAGLKERTRKALAEGTGADGGFLVPDQFINEVLRVELENTVVRGNGARVINMASAIMKIPALNMTSNASGSMFGGIQAYWNGEGATKTASAPKFQQLQLEAKKLIGYVESSDELIDDSIVSLGQLLANALPATIYGIPVVISEKISAKGTAGDVLLADMRYYLIGDRQRLTIDESIHARFQNDEKAWRFVQRVDGQCWLQDAITPRAGGSTISPFVKLGDFGA
jgi:HK97 family phage major capsid protein